MRLPLVPALASGPVRLAPLGPEHAPDLFEAGREPSIWTWLSPSVWRSGVNTHCKLALLSHAFEHLGAPRVVIKTHLSSARSQAAIERIGGGQRRVVAPDPVMRRDSAYYVIPAGRWPEVRARLEGLLLR